MKMKGKIWFLSFFFLLNDSSGNIYLNCQNRQQPSWIYLHKKIFVLYTIRFPLKLCMVVVFSFRKAFHLPTHTYEVAFHIQYIGKIIVLHTSIALVLYVLFVLTCVVVALRIGFFYLCESALIRCLFCK